MYKKLIILFIIAAALLIPAHNSIAKEVPQENTAVTTISDNVVTETYNIAKGRMEYSITKLKPNSAVPSHCLPINWYWDTGGTAYEHPGNDYQYLVEITVECDPGKNFMFAWNGGTGTPLHTLSWYETNYNEYMGCSPGINGAPSQHLAQCSNYFSWEEQEVHVFQMISNVDAVAGCPGYIPQAFRLKYNTYQNNPATVWEEVIYQQRNNFIYRYCT